MRAFAQKAALDRIRCDENIRGFGVIMVGFRPEETKTFLGDLEVSRTGFVVVDCTAHNLICGVKVREQNPKRPMNLEFFGSRRVSNNLWRIPAALSDRTFDIAYIRANDGERNKYFWGLRGCEAGLIVSPSRAATVEQKSKNAAITP